MKSVLKLMVGVAVVVSLHSAAHAKDLVVGVSWSNFQEERWKTDEAAIKAALEASGDKYISADAQSSAAKQLTDVESLISQGANALIILAQDSDAIGPAIEKAAAEGIPVVGYDRLIENPAAFYITFDNKEVGRLQAEGVFKAKPEGNYVFIKGSSSDPNADFLFSGQQEVLKAAIDAGKIKNVGEAYTDGWLPANALATPGATATHKVIVPRTLCFPGPNIKLPPVAALPLGAALAIARQDEPFSVTHNGWYVPAGHIARLTATYRDFVAVAEMLLGAPYLWGGKTTLGVDCSGLVQVALGAAGIACPRDSDMQQAALGQLVPIESLTREQEKFRQQMAQAFGVGAFTSLEDQVRRNMEMFERAFAMFAPFARREESGEAAAEPDNAAAKTGDIGDLKRQLDEMQRKVDQLSETGKKKPE